MGAVGEPELKRRSHLLTENLVSLPPNVRIRVVNHGELHIVGLLVVKFHHLVLRNHQFPQTVGIFHGKTGEPERGTQVRIGDVHP